MKEVEGKIRKRKEGVDREKGNKRKRKTGKVKWRKRICKEEGKGKNKGREREIKKGKTSKRKKKGQE